MPTLFGPIRLGSVEAPNRILMAPLTHARNTRDHVPTTIMVDYVQLVSARLILSGVSPQGRRARAPTV
jgi:N-ethylmaleimide reductase